MRCAKNHFINLPKRKFSDRLSRTLIRPLKTGTRSTEQLGEKYFVCPYYKTKKPSKPAHASASQAGLVFYLQPPPAGSAKLLS